MTSVVLVAALLASAYAQAPGARLTDSKDIDWKASGSLPPGAEYHLIFEDPASHAVQTLVRFPAGFLLPSHSHSHDETVLVLKGKLEVALDSETRTLGPGSYAVIPAGAKHSLKAKGWGRLEMMVSMAGPFDIKGLAPRP